MSEGSWRASHFSPVGGKSKLLVNNPALEKLHLLRERLAKQFGSITLVAYG